MYMNTDMDIDINKQEMFKKIPNCLFQNQEDDDSSADIELLGCFGLQVYITILNNINWNNSIMTNITILGALMDINFRKNPSSKKMIIDKLQLLDEMGYLEINKGKGVEWNNIKVNDVIEIKIHELKRNFTMVTISEMSILRYLTPVEVALYCLIKVSYNKKYGYSFITRNKISELLKCSKTTTVQITKKFEELGILNIWSIEQYNSTCNKTVKNNRYGFDSTTELQTKELSELEPKLLEELLTDTIPVISLKNKQQLQNELDELKLYKVVHNVDYVKIFIKDDVYQIFKIGDYSNVLYSLRPKQPTPTPKQQ